MNLSTDNIDIGIQITKNLGSKYINKSNEWFSLNFLKPYFMIDNYYVLRKIKFLVFPYIFKDIESENNSIDNENNESSNFISLDLYLPIVGFITYLLLLAINLGMTEHTEFNPDIIWFKATKNFSIIGLHAIILKLCKSIQIYLEYTIIVFYIFTNTNVAILDLLSIVSYKMILLSIIVIQWSITNNIYLYYVMFIIFSLSCYFFSVRK